VDDGHARTPGSSHPNGLLWDFGGDSIQTYDQLMAVRRRALQGFSVDVLPDGRQSGELEARLVPVYLLHRYQIEALARLVGGGDYESSTSDDVRSGAARGGVRAVPAAQQREALKRLAASLRAENLALPERVLDALTPPASGFERGREYFGTRMSSVFDALSAAEAASAQTCTFLFDAGRINRLAWQNARDPRQPDVQEVLDEVLARTWKREAVARSVPAGEAVQLASDWVVLDGMLGLIGGGKLHPTVLADVRQQAAGLAQWLAAHPAPGATGTSRKQAAELIRRYLAEPGKVELRPLPAIPPGAPI
jgi:hypothetical protein